MNYRAASVALGYHCEGTAFNLISPSSAFANPRQQKSGKIDVGDGEAVLLFLRKRCVIADITRIDGAANGKSMEHYS